MVMFDSKHPFAKLVNQNLSEHHEFSVPLDLGTPVISKLSELIYFYSRGQTPIAGFESKRLSVAFRIWLMQKRKDPMHIFFIRQIGMFGLSPEIPKYKWSWKLNKAVRL